MPGKLAGRFHRFPLLLKFLDVRETLSVQVHPSDLQTQYIPAGESGKTEAWEVLEAGAQSRIYAGLKPRFKRTRKPTRRQMRRLKRNLIPRPGLNRKEKLHRKLLLKQSLKPKPNLT